MRASEGSSCPRPSHIVYSSQIFDVKGAEHWGRSRPMSDDEPDWLEEQGSARKAAAQRNALESDDSLSIDDVGSADDNVGASQETDEPKPKPKGKGRTPPLSVLPLQLAPKVRRDMLLLEANDLTLDFSGDFGVLGKMHLRKGSSTAAAVASSSQGEADGSVADIRQTAMFDLKGKVYDADIIPCNTLCLLQVDGSKAKIEAVFSDYLQLSAPRDSIFDAQEVSHGELGEGFFDDDDVLSNVDGGSEEEEELGPLREGAKKGKSAGKSGRKPVARKSAGGGAKRKSASGAGKPPAKKEKK